MTALWIVLGVLAAIILLLQIPVRARAEYDGDLRVWLCVLFLRVKLLPRTEKPKKEKKEKPPKAEEKPKEEKPKRKLAPSTLLDYAKLGAELLGDLRRKIRIYDLTVRATFGGKDAADAALNYGRAWAAIGAVTPLLERTFRIKKRDLSAQYDETKDKIELYARAEAGISPAQVITLALKALRGWLAIRKENQTEKVAEKHDKSDQ